MPHAQAHECQKISHQLLDVLWEFNLAWPERILHPVQFVRGIAEASPWIVNTIALSRDLGERHDAQSSQHVLGLGSYAESARGLVVRCSPLNSRPRTSPGPQGFTPARTY